MTCHGDPDRTTQCNLVSEADNAKFKTSNKGTVGTLSTL